MLKPLHYPAGLRPKAATWLNSWPTLEQRWAAMPRREAPCYTLSIPPLPQASNLAQLMADSRADDGNGLITPVKAI